MKLLEQHTETIHRKEKHSAPSSWRVKTCGESSTLGSPLRSQLPLFGAFRLN